MRNLKRALSLTLASVMLLGMMVVGSSALSFNDAEDISNVTAATVLQELGVMIGTDKGNFQPEKPVTRAQMAILICRMLYGDKLDDTRFAGVSQYSDVPANYYYTGSINLATSLGIINGYGNGKFGPDDTVTTAQAALMLCRALGYFDEKDPNTQVISSDWGAGALAAIAQATKLKMLGDLKLGTNEKLARDNVCEMVFNAMTKAVPVHYSERWDVYYTDNQSIMQGVNFNYVDTLAYQNFDLVYNDTQKDDFKRPSTEWGIGTVDGTDDKGNIKSSTIRTSLIKAANDVDVVYSSTSKVSKENVYDVLSGTVRDDLKDGNSKLYVYADGVGGRETDLDKWFRDNNTEAIYSVHPDSTSRKGTLTEIYVDDDNNVTIVIINTYVFKATNGYDSSRDELRVAPAGDTKISLKDLTLSGEDFAVKGVEKDDYLLVTATKNTDGTYDAKTAEAARMLTGKVDTYTVGDSVTIDGKSYSYSAICRKDGDKSTDYTVGQDAVVVLDKYDNIIAVDEARASASFVFIEGIGRSGSGITGSALANAYFTDGTESTITIKQIEAIDENGKVETVKSANSIVADAGFEKQWYNYSVDSAGKYSLYIVDGTKYPGSTKSAQTGTSVGAEDALMVSGKVDFLKTVTGGAMQSVSGMGNDKTIVVVKDKDGDLDTYVGTAAIPDIKVTVKADPEGHAESARAYYLENKNGYIDYVFVNLDGYEASVVGGDEDAAFLFVLKYANQINDPDSHTYFTYKVVNEEGNGDDERSFVDTKVPKSAAAPDGKTYNLIRKVRTNSDGDVTAWDEMENSGKYFTYPITNGTVSFDNNSLNIGGHKFITNADSKIVVINCSPEIGNKEGDDYEIGTYTGDSLRGKLYEKTFNGEIGGATVTDSSRVIDELYVYVKDTKTGGAPGETTAEVTVNFSAGVKDVKINDASVAKGGKATVKTDGTTEVAIELDPGYSVDMGEGKSTGITKDGEKFYATGTAIDIKTTKAETVTLTLDGTLVNAKVYGEDGTKEVPKAEGSGALGNKYTVTKNSKVLLVDSNLSTAGQSVVDSTGKLVGTVDANKRLLLTMTENMTLTGSELAKMFAIHFDSDVTIKGVKDTGNGAVDDKYVIKGNGVWYVNDAANVQYILVSTAEASAVISVAKATDVVEVKKATGTKASDAGVSLDLTTKIAADVWLKPASQVDGTALTGGTVKANGTQDVGIAAAKYVAVGATLTSTVKADKSVGSAVIAKVGATNKYVSANNDAANYPVGVENITLQPAYQVTLNDVTAKLTDNTGAAIADGSYVVKGQAVYPTVVGDKGTGVINVTSGAKWGADTNNTAITLDGSTNKDITLAAAVQLDITDAKVTQKDAKSGDEVTVADGTAAVSKTVFILPDEEIIIRNKSQAPLTTLTSGSTDLLTAADSEILLDKNATGWYKLRVGSEKITAAGN